MNVNNWEELALIRKAWNDLVEKAKTHKANTRSRNVCVCVILG